MIKLNSLEIERRELLAECHGLLSKLGQRTYSNKQLRIARDALRLLLRYKLKT